MAPEYRLLVSSVADDPAPVDEQEGPCSVLHGACRNLQSIQRAAWENGIICASIACIIFSFSSLQVKLTGGRVPVLQLCIIRSSISFCTSIVSGRAAGISPLFGHKQHFPLLFLRGFFGTLAISLSYFALMALPLGDAVTLSRLRPPATAVMARLLLAEPLGLQGVAGCLVSLAGVIILAHPPFLLGGHTDWSRKRMIGTLCGVMSTLFACGTSYAVRKIGKREPALTVAFWYHTTTISLMIWPLLAGIPEAAKLVAWRDCLLLLGIAATSFLAQLLMTRSFQLLAAAKAAAVGFMGVIYSHILGAMIFDEKITLATVLGAGLIFVGILLVTLRDDTDADSKSSQISSSSATSTATKLHADVVQLPHRVASPRLEHDRTGSSNSDQSLTVTVAAYADASISTVQPLPPPPPQPQQQQQQDGTMITMSTAPRPDESGQHAAKNGAFDEDAAPLLWQDTVGSLSGNNKQNTVPRLAWLQRLLWGQKQQRNSHGSSSGGMIESQLATKQELCHQGKQSAAPHGY